MWLTFPNPWFVGGVFFFVFLFVCLFVLFEEEE